MFAGGAGPEVFYNFISDFEPFEMNDADEFAAVFPDLTLSKFERHEIEGNPSLRLGSTERRQRELLFLAGGLLAGDGRFFAGGGAVGFGTFLAGLLLVRFRGFISHNF